MQYIFSLHIAKQIFVLLSSHPAILTRYLLSSNCMSAFIIPNLSCTPKNVPRTLLADDRMQSQFSHNQTPLFHPIPTLPFPMPPQPPRGPSPPFQPSVPPSPSPYTKRSTVPIGTRGLFVDGGSEGLECCTVPIR